MLFHNRNNNKEEQLAPAIPWMAASRRRVGSRVKEVEERKRGPTWVGSALVRMVAVRTSCVTTRCSWRCAVVRVVAVNVFSSICDVVEFLSLSSLVSAVRVVTCVALT